MNRYRRLLYLLLCLLLFNIYVYVESPETFQIDDDFPVPVGPEVVSEYLKNREFEIPLSEALENEIRPDDLVQEDAVEEDEPEIVESVTKPSYQKYVIPKDFNEDGLATQEELRYIFQKARLATVYLLEFNTKKGSKHSLILPNLGPDERFPILLNLDRIDHWYLDCEFDGIRCVYKVKSNIVIFGVVINVDSIFSTYRTIWKSRSYYEFANKVVANGELIPDGIEKVSVFLENGEIKHYVNTTSGWMERSRCIVVDIDLKQSTFDYVYVNDGVKHIYEPRYDFKISKIKFGTSYLRCKSHFVFWEAKDKSEYAKKVECISVTIDDPTYVVILIYMLNGNITKLVDGGKGWFPLDLKKVCSVKLALWCTCESFSYFVYDMGTYRIFEAKKGYNFFGLVNLKINTLSIEEVWEADNRNEFAYKVMIDGIKCFMDCKMIIIYHISGKFTHLRRIDKKWIVIEPSITLRINDKESIIAYNYFKANGEIEYFIPNGGFLFKEVIEFEGLISKTVVNIWKPKNKYEYAYKAVLIKLERNSKYLVLLLVNKNILLFHRLDSGKPWVRRPTDNLTLHELKMMAVDLSDPRELNEQKRQKIYLNTVGIVPSEPSEVPEPQPVVPVSKPLPLMNPDKLVDLDITKVYGIRGYDIFYRDNRLIFEARENYFFKSVTKHNEVLWKPKNITDLPNRVLYKRVNNNDKIKVYFPDKIKEEPSKPKPKLSIDPSTILVDASKCRKPGSEFIKATVVEVSGTPANTTLEDQDDLLVSSKPFRKKQWVVDDD